MSQRGSILAYSGTSTPKPLYRPLFFIGYMKTVKTKITKACDNIKALLLSKNEKYGDSALTPLGIFSKLNSAEAIKARIDDKLSRIANTGLNDATEDTLDDLIGYLLLLKIANGDLSRANSASITLDLSGVSC